MPRGSQVLRACITMLLLFPSLPGNGGRLLGQPEAMAVAPEGPPSTALEVLIFATLNSNLTRLDVFHQVSYASLSFVKEESRYTASYEMTISVYDSANGLVQEKTWTERLRAATFDETVSPSSYSLTERSFAVRPGRYRVECLLRDNESKITTRLTREVQATDFARYSFALSSLMLLNHISVQDGKTSITPNISGNVGDDPDSFYVFLEGYSRLQPGLVKFAVRITNDKNASVYASDTVQFVHEGRNEILLLIRDSALTLGEYQLEVAASPQGPAGRGTADYLAVSRRPFANRWRGLPRDDRSLDLAIEQLEYIAKDSELSYLRSAATTQEKQRRFMEFWRKRSTNPNTTRNFTMEQYYRRVEYANRHFSRFRTGWKSDMGMVYIIFGPPGNIERHPFEANAKPYEVWDYYDLNYQFVFVDDSGFGDYRLNKPIWDYWKRPKD